MMIHMDTCGFLQVNPAPSMGCEGGHVRDWSLITERGGGYKMGGGGAIKWEGGGQVKFYPYEKGEGWKMF